MSSAAVEVQEKLWRMGGNDRLKVVIPRLRKRLSDVRSRYWLQSQAPGRIKRYLYLEQEPSADEVEDVRAAYARFCPERIVQNRAENAELIEAIIKFAHHAQRADPEFFGQHLQALRAQLLQLGGDVLTLGKPD